MADSNRVIDVPDGAPLICPACSHALTAVAAPVRKPFNPLVPVIVIALLVAAGALFLGRNPKTAVVGTINPVSSQTPPELRLHGSNTIGAELAPLLAKSFLAAQGATDVKVSAPKPDESLIQGNLNGEPVAIQIAAHGSATAFQDLASGKTDIGMASRAVKLDEEASLNSLGDMTSPACEHVLGLDGIAVIVNESNPVQSLSKEQLARIFSGEISEWNQIPGNPASGSGKITLYSLDNRSGTYDSFKSMVLGTHALAAGTSRLEDSRKLADAIAADPSGIGFVGLPYVRGVKAVPVSDAGARALVPNHLTVATEDYPLSRRLYLYTAANPTNANVRKFIDFALSTKGQDLVAQAGFIAQNVSAESTPAISTAAPDQYKHLTDGANRLSLDFRFRSGSSELDNKARVDVSRVAGFMADLKYDPKNVMLFGFADNRGGQGPNVQLSKTRAQAVADQLETAGIHPGVVLGFGSETPVASNDTEAGREKNRRVEIWVKK